MRWSWQQLRGVLGWQSQGINMPRSGILDHIAEVLINRFLRMVFFTPGKRLQTSHRDDFLAF